MRRSVRLSRPEPFAGRIEFVEGDLLDLPSLLNACEGVEAIVSAVSGDEEMMVTGQINLIKAALPERKLDSTWAELGCGTGTFTNALATLLSAGSKIYAIDKENQLLQSTHNGAQIVFIKANFENAPIPHSNLDGILMANSLHYIKDKLTFARKLVEAMKPNGQLIVVEYDRTNANHWVPYPISFVGLKDIFSALGFDNIKKIGERNSIYGSGKMYACSIRQSR